MFDLAILGGGPAGVAAGVYASRKKLNTVLITKEFGGQSVESPDVQNWIGTISVTGIEFAKMLEEHLRAYAGECVEIHTGRCVRHLARRDDGFRITTEDEITYEARTVLVATGAHRRKLDVPGAAQFEQKGLTYCASCDGPMFSGMDVAVVGGGNAGFESAAQLLAYTKSVTLLEVADAFHADPVTVEKVLAHPNMSAITNAKPLEVLGEQMVTGLRYRDTASGEEHMLSVTGIFVEIGLIPTTAFVTDVLPLDGRGHIPIDPRTQQTSAAGLWAAGDCTDALYQQNNIAAGDAVRALEDIYLHLKTK